MNLLYTVNEAFVPQLAASVASVCENSSPNDAIHFFVFCDKVSQTSKETLRSFLNKYCVEIDFIDIDGFMEAGCIDFDTQGWNEIVLSRLLLARFLASDIQRVLYLDADTMVRGSLKELWDAPLNEHGCIIGACPEPTVSSKRMKALGHGGKPYFNAGVLLIDLESWRRNEIEKQLLECLKERGAELFANDQDAINLVLDERIMPLPVKYNYCNSFYYYPLSMLKRVSPWFDPDPRRYSEWVSNPVIVHFLGEDRPWRLGNTHRYSNEYLQNLSLTPWKGQGMEDGWHFYYAAWSLFNMLTGPFPMLRYRLITNMIPSVMRLRARGKRNR